MSLYNRKFYITYMLQKYCDEHCNICHVILISQNRDNYGTTVLLCMNNISFVRLHIFWTFHIEISKIRYQLLNTFSIIKLKQMNSLFALISMILLKKLRKYLENFRKKCYPQYIYIYIYIQRRIFVFLKIYLYSLRIQFAKLNSIIWLKQILDPPTKYVHISRYFGRTPTSNLIACITIRRTPLESLCRCVQTNFFSMKEY